MTHMRYRCVGNDVPYWQQGSHPQRIEHEAVMRQTLVRQAKLGASCRVKVPAGRETRTVTRKG